MHHYVATVRVGGGQIVKVAFKSQATKTGSVTTHAREAAERQGHTDVTVTRVVADLTKTDVRDLGRCEHTVVRDGQPGFCDRPIVDPIDRVCDRPGDHQD